MDKQIERGSHSTEHHQDKALTTHSHASMAEFPNHDTKRKQPDVKDYRL